MNDVTKIKLPPSGIESESPTPVQFLPSAMLSWRAPIMPRREPAKPRPESLRNACAQPR